MRSFTPGIERGTPRSQPTAPRGQDVSHGWTADRTQPVPLKTPLRRVPKISEPQAIRAASGHRHRHRHSVLRRTHVSLACGQPQRICPTDRMVNGCPALTTWMSRTALSISYQQPRERAPGIAQNVGWRFSPDTKERSRPRLTAGRGLGGHDHQRRGRWSPISSRDVGQNRRYGSDVTRAAIAESVLRPKPVSLSRAQVGEPVIRASRPIPVIAWVTFPGADVEIDAHAIAWTDRAVLLRFELRDRATRECWVWASAVRRSPLPGTGRPR